MKILVFDTETTGLPNSKIINPDTLNFWPHIVQFSYVIYDINLNDIVETHDSIINVKDIIIPEETIKIHGITKDISNKKGVAIELVLNEFFYHLCNVDLLVGHNVSFDINMVKVELLRMIYENKLISEKEINTCNYNLHYLTNFKNICCTLKDSIDVCNIKAIDRFGKEYIKFPKLIELHEKLFESTPNNLHNSFNDILVTLRCFMKLKYDIDLNIKCNKFIETVNAIKLL
jgi:DNA polymerase III epsilon subunit-like protein